MITNDVNPKPLFYLPRAAILKSDPFYHEFDREDELMLKICGSLKIKVLNHTDLDIKITYSDGADLIINKTFLGNFDKSCELIFYGLQGYPNLICGEILPDDKGDNKFLFKNSNRINLLSLKKNVAESDIHKLSESAFKIEDFILILLGKKDEKSILSETKMPEDIVKKIACQYVRCIHSDFNHLLLNNS